VVLFSFSSDDDLLGCVNVVACVVASMMNTL